MPCDASEGFTVHVEMTLSNVLGKSILDAQTIDNNSYGDAGYDTFDDHQVELGGSCVLMQLRSL